MLGIERLHLFLDSLQGRRIAVVSNQTSVVGDVHLVDSLLGMHLNVVKVFVPEHGFRGQADAGEKVHSTVDEKTGIPLISLYGNNKKPTEEQLADIDIVIYDIQDVGVRFYTYISTLHYVMEACAENNKQLIVLDRPNPNGHYIDGPVREPQYKSFVGMHPVPIVYG
ncbi:MAG: exo-beta-N-acetylmuramidase NamZ domain-containing protein, partial [Flavobacteriales bacterium]